jgi:hypothetical protein
VAGVIVVVEEVEAATQSWPSLARRAACLGDVYPAAKGPLVFWAGGASRKGILWRPRTDSR